jgi:hypothetical protein
VADTDEDADATDDTTDEETAGVEVSADDAADDTFPIEDAGFDGSLEHATSVNNSAAIIEVKIKGFIKAADFSNILISLYFKSLANCEIHGRPMAAPTFIYYANAFCTSENRLFRSRLF